MVSPVRPENCRKPLISRMKAVEIGLTEPECRNKSEEKQLL